MLRRALQKTDPCPRENWGHETMQVLNPIINDGDVRFVKREVLFCSWPECNGSVQHCV